MSMTYEALSPQSMVMSMSYEDIRKSQWGVMSYEHENPHNTFLWSIMSYELNYIVYLALPPYLLLFLLLFYILHLIFIYYYVTLTEFNNKNKTNKTKSTKNQN